MRVTSINIATIVAIMKTTAAFLFVLATLGGVTANATVIFNWATVGNPGNDPDITGYGAVSYNYRISRHEVTNAQYTEFLNAVDPTGTNSLALYSSLCPATQTAASTSTAAPRTVPNTRLNRNAITIQLSSCRTSTPCDSPTGYKTAKAAAQRSRGCTRSARG